MKKAVKILLYSLLIVLVSIKLVGCFTFRDSVKAVNDTFAQKGFEVRSRSVHTEDRSIHFVHTGYGDSTKTVLCFIHGSPGASNNFNNNLLDTLLQEKFEMISVDRPGFGYSDFGEALPNLAGQSKCIKAVLDSFLGRRIILVGHSYGGPLIGQLCVDYPDDISGLVIVAGSIDPDLEPEEWWRKPANSGIGRFILPKIMTTSNAEILTLKNDLEKLKTRWDEIEQPVIVVQGGKDNLVPPGNADFAEEQITNSSYFKIYRYPKLNHFIPFKNHEVITKAAIEMDSVLDVKHESDSIKAQKIQGVLKE